MSWPDFWLQPARDPQAALRQAVRAVSLELGCPEAPPSLAVVAARPEGGWLVRMMMRDRGFAVIVAEEGAHVEILAAIPDAASFAA